MHRERLLYWSPLLLLPFLLGMGLLGETQVRENAPEPAERLDAVIVDMEGTELLVTHVSYDGALYLPVYRGRALITVPFQKVHKLVFGESNRSRRQVTIHFVAGNTETFWMDETVLFVGRLPYGTYQITAKDIQTLEFQKPPAE